ncbi:ATP-binding protein [Streptomyces sp. SL13]|uniref:ATP-binding protein n=1 Tax=Streptantibioticus silvisoli TaxID=2705255 RepID=A0AA90KH46_9ACTN|nr:ATP-binding protein [Streptantibioticus silvisoli]MDI5970964.1 ATP-binding protein [Streptantibioticus silvisoli]
MGTGVVPEAPEAVADAVRNRLRDLERRVAEAVLARRAVDPDPDDPYRGQYLTPEAAERLLASPAGPHCPAAAPPDPPEAPPGSGLGRMAAAFGLSPLDVELLLVAVAPDVDARFERLYGYLNDDLTRRRPTIGLALELCGLPAAGPGRFRLAARSPLIAHGLLHVLDSERPLLSRELRAPDRITAHLLGDDTLDDALDGFVHVPLGPPDQLDPAGGTARRIAAAVATGGPVHLVDEAGRAGQLAVDALRAAALLPLVLDAAALTGEPDQPERLRALAREARLSGGGLVLGPLERLSPHRSPGSRLLRELCDATRGVPVVTHAAHGWDPAWSGESPVVMTVPVPGPARRTELWTRTLAAAAARHGHPPAPAPDGLAELAATYRLDTDQVERAATVAVRSAAALDRPVTVGDLRAAVRAQNGTGLARLARRIEPAVGWRDLVLPPSTERQLREFALRAKHRDQVLGRWGMRPGGGRGHGVIALFAGESGTGKTMSAEVVAAELGMTLYVVDLSGVVDKYIGETEKNLERIFVEASRVNGVLLFDEADAIFGRRSQVKDAHDRHANVESAYLLQRVEAFDGIAVLTTNLRSNLDEAFTRRLDVIAEFPLPDAGQRRALWDRCLGTAIPRAADLDLDRCARRFELAGGSIRACAVTAAYRAAESGGPLGMVQVMAAVLAEYRKLGRLVLESDFGPWLTADHSASGG